MNHQDDPGDQGYCLGRLAAVGLDAEGTVTSWSDEAAALLEQPAASVLGHPFRRLLIATPGDPAPSALPTSGIVRLRHGAAGEVAVCLRLIALEPPARGSVLLLAPAGAAREWGHAVSLLRAIMRQESLGFGIHGDDLRVQLTNLTAGGPHSAPVAPGDRLQDYLPAPDAAAVEAVFSEVLRTGEPVLRHRQRTRSRVTPEHHWVFSLSAFRLEDADGRPTGVAAMVRDITEEERVQRDRELLHRAAMRIGPSLRPDRIALALADVIVEGFADYASVDLYEPVLLGESAPTEWQGGQTRFVRAAAARATGPWPAELMQVGAAYPALPDSPALRRLQHGETLVLDRAQVESALGDPGLTRTMVPAAATSLAVAPLIAGGGVLGAVSAWRTADSDRFDAGEGELLTEIASRAAIGVENARRFTREHQAAAVLRERLLPRTLTDTPAAETAGAYRSADSGTGVSGDWFDVIELPSMRTAFVIGDVIGHDLAAAATMGRLRTAIQTYADLELEPSEILARAEQLVARMAAEAGPEQWDTVGATCLCAVYDPTTCTCVLASAGHPSPLLIGPDGTTRILDLPHNPPLSAGGTPFQSATVDMAPGSVLAMYTDGLLRTPEFRSGWDWQRVQDELGAGMREHRPLRKWCDGLMPAPTEATLSDDVAILLARTRRVDPGDVAHWQFRADPASVADARTLTERQLADWDLEHLAFTAELVISELITNAIRYAEGPVSLRLIRGRALICEVGDDSNTQPRLIRAAETDEGGRGLYIVAQCTSRWGCRYGQKGKTIWTELPLSGEEDRASHLVPS